MTSPPLPVRIVPGTAADVGLVRRLADEIWREYYPGIVPLAQIDYMLEHGYSEAALGRFVRDEGAGLAILHAEARPAGFAAWYRPGEPATTKLDKLYVHPRHQRRGYGAMMVGRACEVAREQGCSRLALAVNKNNRSAIAAYLKHGFRIDDAVVKDIGGGFVMDDYIMVKPVMGNG